MKWRIWIWRAIRVAFIIAIVALATVLVRALVDLKYREILGLWHAVATGQGAREGWKAVLTMVATSIALWQAVTAAALFSGGVSTTFDRRTLPHVMGAVAGLTGAMVFGSSIGSENSIFGSEPAAWAQAGGSIEALLISVYVGQMALEADERRRRGAKVDFVEAITTSVDMALNNAEPIRFAIRDHNLNQLKGQIGGLDQGALEPLHLILGLPIDRWPSVVLFTRVRAVQWQLQALLDQVRRDLPSAHVPENNFFTRIYALEAALRSVEDAYRQSVAGVELD